MTTTINWNPTTSSAAPWWYHQGESLWVKYRSGKTFMFSSVPHSIAQDLKRLVNPFEIDLFFIEISTGTGKRKKHPITQIDGDPETAILKNLLDQFETHLQTQFEMSLHEYLTSLEEDGNPSYILDLNLGGCFGPDYPQELATELENRLNQLSNKPLAA